MKPEKLQLLQAQVRKLDSISTAPVILQPLLEMLRAPSDKVSLDKVVQLASYDGAIAAQCLRLANSPLYGCRQVETVKAAILALGTDRVRSMLFGLCMNRVIPKGKWVLDPLAFWRHSLGCALVTQRIARRIGYPEPDQAYLAGLLHDLGLLVNSVLYTDDFRKCVALASTERRALQVCEEEILGFTHCESGRLLCEHWRLPLELSEAVRHHHDLTALPSPPPLACLVHLSDLLCRVCSLGYGYEEIMGIELASDPAWQGLQAAYPTLGGMDLARFTLDIEGAMDQVVAAVDAVFGAPVGTAKS
jgi:HD-like signal output (HDOD) protein